MTDNATDLQLIRQTVQFYFDGMYNSDVETLRKAFHPTAALMGYYDGTLAHIPLENWLEMVKERPAPSKSGEEYDMKLVSMDVTENVASVKVKDLYLGLRFTDYLHLMKVDGNWLIVNKMFHHEPRPEIG